MGSLTYWNDTYTVGNDLLDGHHKKLLEISGRAFRILAAPHVPHLEFDALLNDYAETQREHFAAEERALARNQYPKLAAHVAEHDALRAQLTDLLCRADEGESYIRGLLALMADYAGNHLLHTDLECKPYLKGR